MLASLLFIVSNCLGAAVAVSLIHASQLARDNFNVIDLEENVFKTVSTIIPNVLIVFGAILLLIVVVGVLGLLVPRRKKLLTLWMALDNFMIIVLSLCAIAFLILRGNLRDDIDTNTANIWDDNNSITEAQALANLEVTFSCCGFQSPIDRPVSRSCLGPTPQFTTVSSHNISVAVEQRHSIPCSSL